MLDDLDKRSGVKAGQTLIAIRQWAVEESDALPLGVVHLIEPQPPCCDLQGADGHIDTDHLVVTVADEALQQSPGSTAQIEHATGTGGPDH